MDIKQVRRIEDCPEAWEAAERVLVAIAPLQPDANAAFGALCTAMFGLAEAAGWPVEVLIEAFADSARATFANRPGHEPKS